MIIPIDKAIVIVRKFLTHYLDLMPEREETSKTIEEIRSGIQFKGANVWILIFAVFIASLGLNTNSTAVIIGAMLISPLMGPIMGIGLGIGINDFELIKKSAMNLAVATAFSIVTSTLFFLLSPLNDARSELLARTSPTIYDVLIALFGGLAGIVAMSTKQKGNVIPGVAIATALMPPLCTAGFGLASGNLHYFFGALYLYVINSVFIAAATIIGSKVMKFPPKVFLDKEREKRVHRIIYTILFLTVVPSVFLTYNMIRTTMFENSAYTFVNQEFNTTHTQILNKSAYIEDGQRIIEVTLIGKEIPADSILLTERRLASHGLAGTQLHVSQGYQNKEVDINSLSGMMFEDIYKDSQQKIEKQASQIAQLERQILHTQQYDSLGIEIAPEISVLFPQIAEVAIAKTMLSNIEALHLDTVTLVVVKYATPLTDDEATLFKQWIGTRVGVNNVHLVEER